MRKYYDLHNFGVGTLTGVVKECGEDRHTDIHSEMLASWGLNVWWTCAIKRGGRFIVCSWKERWLANLSRMSLKNSLRLWTSGWRKLYSMLSVHTVNICTQARGRHRHSLNYGRLCHSHVSVALVSHGYAPMNNTHLFGIHLLLARNP